MQARSLILNPIARKNIHSKGHGWFISYPSDVADFESPHVTENNLEFMRVTLGIGCGKMCSVYLWVVCRIVLIWDDWLPISWLPWSRFETDSKTLWDKKDLFQKWFSDWLHDISQTRSDRSQINPKLSAREGLFA